MREWLLLIYKVPREPTAARVYVWRKLKQLGVLLMHDSVWVLPASDRNQEQLQWLAAEISEWKGEATLARSQLLDADQEQQLVGRFRDQADQVYRQVLADLKKKRCDLTALSRRFQQAQALDFFHSELAARARKALLAAHGEQSS